MSQPPVQAAAPQPVQNFYQQISANRRQSILLVLLLSGILGVFGFVIGFALSGHWQGGVVALVIAILISLGLASLSYFSGDSLVLAVSGAREVNPTDRSAADERGAGAGDRREHPHAARLRH